MSLPQLTNASFTVERVYPHPPARVFRAHAEKDAVRLTPFLPLEAPLFVLPLRFVLSPEDAERLTRLLAEVAPAPGKGDGE